MCSNFVLDTHFESGIGIGIHGELKCEEATIFKINSDSNKFSVYKVKIEDNMYKSNLCRTQIKVHFFEPIKQKLTSLCANHLIVFYDEKKDDLINKLTR